MTFGGHEQKQERPAGGRTLFVCLAGFDLSGLSGPVRLFPSGPIL